MITHGKGHLVFWTRRKDGFFDRHDMVNDERTVTCLDVLESGDLVAGDDSGMYNPHSTAVYLNRITLFLSFYRFNQKLFCVC